MNKKEFKKLLKKTWHFIWEDNSIWSWIANVIIAFILIKFIVYPGLGLLLSTSHPVVAVVSSSMEHKTVLSCVNGNCAEKQHTMCDKVYGEKKSFGLDDYWEECGKWYMDNTQIDKNKFLKFSFR